MLTDIAWKQNEQVGLAMSCPGRMNIRLSLSTLLFSEAIVLLLFSLCFLCFLSLFYPPGSQIQFNSVADIIWRAREGG